MWCRLYHITTKTTALPASRFNKNSHLMIFFSRIFSLILNFRAIKSDMKYNGISFNGIGDSKKNCRFVNILRRHPWHFSLSVFAKLPSREAFVSVWRQADKRMLCHSFSNSSPSQLERFVVIVSLNNTGSRTKLARCLWFIRGTQNMIGWRKVFLIQGEPCHRYHACAERWIVFAKMTLQSLKHCAHSIFTWNNYISCTSILCCTMLLSSPLNATQ